jgi:hypothetical protein
MGGRISTTQIVLRKDLTFLTCWQAKREKEKKKRERERERGGGNFCCKGLTAIIPSHFKQVVHGNK